MTKIPIFSPIGIQKGKKIRSSFLIVFFTTRWIRRRSLLRSIYLIFSSVDVREYDVHTPFPDFSANLYVITALLVRLDPFSDA